MGDPSAHAPPDCARPACPDPPCARPDGRDSAGHPLYRVSDVRDLLVEKLRRDAENEEKCRAKAEKVAS
ncbi:hypothetical protein GCM10023178_03340 [Actinomadura luteofluorescens]